MMKANTTLLLFNLVKRVLMFRCWCEIEIYSSNKVQLMRFSDTRKSLSCQHADSENALVLYYKF